jgi:phosphatidylinositol alpha-1,6-mannosyltransferase
VVDGNNVQEIAARAIELLQDSALRARMGNSGRQWVVDEWRWQIWSEQFNKTLKISN